MANMPKHLYRVSRSISDIRLFTMSLGFLFTLSTYSIHTRLHYIEVIRHSLTLNKTTRPLTPLLPGSSGDCNILLCFPPLYFLFWSTSITTSTQLTQIVLVIFITMSAPQIPSAGNKADPDPGPNPGTSTSTATSTSTSTGNDSKIQGSYWRGYSINPPRNWA